MFPRHVYVSQKGGAVPSPQGFNGQVFDAAFRSGGLSPDAEAVTRKIWANQPSRLQC